MIYYSAMSTLGSDFYPVEFTETFIASIINISSILAYGVIIGQFSDVL